jgi:DNA-binding transcriptional MerR regulator
MPYKRLSTAKIASAVGCHPNTVRLYEQIGWISPVPRSPKGYRLYTEEHLEQMRFARLAMQGAYPNPVIRKAIIDVILASAARKYAGAIELAYRLRSVVRLEREQAEAAVSFLEAWAYGEVLPSLPAPLQTSQTASLLNITIDTLRSWERSNLIQVPRDPRNRYRRYGATEIGRLRVIRLLRQAGYSPMAVLRMLLVFENSPVVDFRRALDTPRPDEDVVTAADRWLTTLSQQEAQAERIIHQAKALLSWFAPGEAQQ